MKLETVIIVKDETDILEVIALGRDDPVAQTLMVALAMIMFDKLVGGPR